MATAARAFLASLDEAQRARLRFPLQSDERTDWHYVPRRRNGIPLADLTAPQREAAHALLRSALSEAGYAKATGIIELEAILGRLSGDADFRDPERYFFTLFGDPAAEAPWGWRFEGHHLSLNLTAIPGAPSAATPMFLGANPATVPSGPEAGLRVLADEEDLGRALLGTLDAAQRAAAVIAARAPRDIITGADPKVQLTRFEGLPASALSPEQSALLWRLIETYLGAIEDEIAAPYRTRLRATPPDSLFFAWAGGAAPGEGHYYRIHGPRLLIEYDNTQGGANHVHAVWRDPAGDFGEDALRRHYREHPHH